MNNSDLEKRVAEIEKQNAHHPVSRFFTFHPHAPVLQAALDVIEALSAREVWV